MDNDDELNCQALEKFAAAIEQTGAEILYSDQDIVDTEGGHREPLCKPDSSQDLLLSQMYIGHLLGFKKTLFEKAGGFRSEYNGSQDYDLMLRMSELTDHISTFRKFCIPGEPFQVPRRSIRNPSPTRR